MVLVPEVFVVTIDAASSDSSVGVVRAHDTVVRRPHTGRQVDPPRWVFIAGGPWDTVVAEVCHRFDGDESALEADVGTALRTAGITLDDVLAVVAGVGPGLPWCSAPTRVAQRVAPALPLLEVSSLDAVAYGSNGYGDYVIAMDLGGGEVSWVVCDESGWRRTEPRTDYATALAGRIRRDPTLGGSAEYGVMDIGGSGALAYWAAFDGIPVDRWIDGPGLLEFRPCEPLPLSLFKRAESEIRELWPSS